MVCTGVWGIPLYFGLELAVHGYMVHFATWSYITVFRLHHNSKATCRLMSSTVPSENCSWSVKASHSQCLTDTCCGVARRSTLNLCCWQYTRQSLIQYIFLFLFLFNNSTKHPLSTIALRFHYIYNLGHNRGSVTLKICLLKINDLQSVDVNLPMIPSVIMWASATVRHLSIMGI